MIELWHGDCLELMKQIPDESIDAVITDPPYGTTACKWDSVIPFEPMWSELKRIIKPNGAIVLFGGQPFTSSLIMSNPSMFRYSWVWDKEYGTDFQLAKLRPMRCHEDIAIFSHAKTANGSSINMKYYPQKTPLNKPVKNGGAPTTKLLNDNSMKRLDVIYTEKSPMTVIRISPVFNSKNNPRLHPTQKPVALLEYLVKTYTNENETVLDFTMGSGTTGVACKNLNRNFIGIEISEEYLSIAMQRIGVIDNG